MLILYRYLLRQFLQIFMICFCSMDGLYIVIDAFTNSEEFISYGEKHGGGTCWSWENIMPIAASRFSTCTSGIVALIAAMFTFALFQRYNELTALLAAGIPKRRIVKPMVIAVVAHQRGGRRQPRTGDSRDSRSTGARFARFGRRTGQGHAPQARRFDRHSHSRQANDGQRPLQIDRPEFHLARHRWTPHSSNCKRPMPIICRRRPSIRADTCSRA